MGCGIENPKQGMSLRLSPRVRVSAGSPRNVTTRKQGGGGSHRFEAFGTDRTDAMRMSKKDLVRVLWRVSA